MIFWDSICSFHEARVRDNLTDDSGLRAVKLIRLMLESDWSVESAARHPLTYRLGWASSENNAWLDLYSRKLKAASRIPGFSIVGARLGRPADYLAAFSELEVALKLSLSGHNVSFVPRSDNPTPDLIAFSESSAPFNVEITSLNRPDQERQIQQLFMGIVHEGLRCGLSTGGTISRAPNRDQLANFILRVKQEADKAKAEHKMFRVNMPGVSTVYLAPPDLAESIPEDSRHVFRMVQPRRWSTEEQIGRKLKDKADALAMAGRPGVLVIYSWMVDREEIMRLFQNPGDDVGPSLASYPGVSGLVLTGSVSDGTLNADPPTQHNKHRVMVNRRSSTDERELSVIWRNPHADEPLPDTVIEALEAYPDHVFALPAADFAAP